MQNTKTFPNNETSLALMAQKITFIDENVKDIKTKLEADYVTKDQFEPIKRIVWGLVGLILTAVVVSLMALIINKQ